MHVNVPGFLNRGALAPLIGFDYFFDAYSYEESIRSWRTNDGLFLAQSWKHILREYKKKKKIFAYLITLQAHHPFINHSPETTINWNLVERKLERHYLAIMREIDKRFWEFFQTFRQSKLHGNTLLVIYSDHSSALRKRVLGKEMVPAFLYFNGCTPEKITETAIHMDIAPTICHLLGIEEPGNWLGYSVFSQTDKRVALFNDLSCIFLDDKGELKNGNGKIYEPQLLYSLSMYDK
jgi:phosphoglycerol transferase MdoB-like AlkP superfamily enzyme